LCVFVSNMVAFVRVRVCVFVGSFEGSARLVAVRSPACQVLKTI
jgi:hypothetical protein